MKYLIYESLNEKAKTSAYAKSLRDFFYINFDQAYQTENLVAQALYLQEAIFLSHFYTDQNFRPKTEEDHKTLEELVQAYQYTLEVLTREASKTKGKKQQKFHAIITLGRYFLAELSNKPYIHEAKMAYSINFGRLLGLADLTLIQRSNIDKKISVPDQMKQDHQTSSLNIFYHQRYQIARTLDYSNEKQFDECFDIIRDGHKSFCDEHAARHGTLEYLANQIKTGSLNSIEIPTLDSGFDEEKLPATLRNTFSQKSNEKQSFLHQRWYRELSEEPNFQTWSGKSSDSSRPYALRQGLLAFGGVCIAAAVITLVVAAVILGVGQMKVLERAVTWFARHAWAYASGTLAGAAAVGVLSYQYRKHEFTFKQNAILSQTTNNNSQTLNNQ